MKNDYLKWAALLAALVATASAEYELARQVGFNQWVAAAVPGALDIYTVRALRAHRDVLAAVAAMIGVNAASHLVTAGLLPVDVPLVVAVSAIAPLVLWRVHRLADEHETPVDPTKLDVIQLETSTDLERVPEETPAIEVRVPDVPEGVPAGVRLLPIIARPAEALDVIQTHPVPAAEHVRTRPEVHAEYVPETDTDNPKYATDYGLGLAAEQFKGQLLDGRVPSIRDIKSKLSVGQGRAKEIQDAFREALPELAGSGATS